MKKDTIAMLVIGVIFLAIIIYALTAKKTTTVTQAGTTTTQGGLGDLIASIFGGTASGTGSGGSGGGIGSWLSNLFGSKPKTNKYCDCNRPGYALDGNPDSLCNSGSTQFEIDCLK